MDTENIKFMVTYYGLRVLIAIALFLVGKWLCGWLSDKTSATMIKRQVNPTLAGFTRRLLYISLMVCVIIAILQYLGVPTGQFMIVLGSAGLAVGLAMKDTLTNFAAGIMITMMRPFNVGDYVEAGGQGGTVVEVQLQNTILNTPDNVRVVMPNGKILADKISNYSVNGKRRLSITVRVSYDDDLQKATEVIMAVLKADERVLEDPAPVVAVTEFADSSINIAVRPWATVGDYWGLYFDLHKKIKVALDENGITIPFPQRVIHMQNNQQ